MIQLTKLGWATVEYATALTKEEQEFLAGDIENWLQTKKGIICTVEVK